MASFNSADRTFLLKGLVLFFDAAPGKAYLDDFARRVIDFQGSTRDAVSGLLNAFAADNTLFPIKYGAGQTPAEFATTLLNILGIQSGTQAFTVGQAELIALVPNNSPAEKVAAMLTAIDFLATTTDPLFTSAAAQLNNKAAVSEYYSVTVGRAALDVTTLQQQLAGITSDATTVAAARSAIDAQEANQGTLNLELTAGLDNLFGNALNNVFTARLIEGDESLGNGDRVQGAGGFDQIIADIDGAENGVILSPTLLSVEQATFRAQDNTATTGGNNLNNITIDAELMVGTNVFETRNSRSDLRIEDVKTDVSQVILMMTGTDPASVLAVNEPGLGGTNAAGLEVYFEDLNRPADNVSNQLNVLIADQDSVPDASGLSPITRNFGTANATDLVDVNGFIFRLTNTDGSNTDVTLQSADIQAAGTYAQLLAAVQTQLAASAVAGRVSVALSTPFQVRANSGNVATVQNLVFTVTDGSNAVFSEIAPGSAAGFFDDNFIIGNADTLQQANITAVQAQQNLIAVDVLLDRVGTGSESGDFIAGEMSTRGGIEQFDVYVDRGSWLTSMQSTNNTLQNVIATNTLTDVIGRVNFEQGNNTADNGYLYIGAASDQTLVNTNNGSQNPNAPTFLQIFTANGASRAGLLDVQNFNAASMVGDVKVAAQISENVFGKYAPLTVSNNNVIDVPFTYTGGAGNDSFNIVVADTLFAQDRTNQAGLLDFSLDVNGGTGNDAIKVDIEGFVADLASAQTLLNFKTLNQGENANNVPDESVLNGGAAGSVKDNMLDITGGEGNDAVFTNALDTRVDGNGGADVFWSNQNGGETITSGGANAANANLNSERGGLNNSDTNGTGTGVAATASSALSKAIYVLNGAEAAGSTDFDNTISGANDSFFFQTSGNFVGNSMSLTLVFRGITQTVVVNPSQVGVTRTDGTTTVTGNVVRTTDVNAAIANAIASNAVLNTVLVAENGPGFTQRINVLIDKLLGADTTTDADDLEIVFTMSNNGAATPVPVNLTATTVNSQLAAAVVGTAANLIDGYLDDTHSAASQNNDAIGVAGTQAVSAGASSVVNAVDTADANDLIDGGAAALGLSDNIFDGGTGNDIIVLDTGNTTFVGTLPTAPFLSGAALDAARGFNGSNETVVATTGMGRDTVFNFQADTTVTELDVGADQFDFTGIGGNNTSNYSRFDGDRTTTGAIDNVTVGTPATAAGTFNIAASSISVVGLSSIDTDVITGTTTQITAADLAALSTTELQAWLNIAANRDGNVGTTAESRTHVIAIVDDLGTNADFGVADIYTFTTSGAGAARTAAAPTLVGTIDLADQSWFALGDANFV